MHSCKTQLKISKLFCFEDDKLKKCFQIYLNVDIIYNVFFYNGWMDSNSNPFSSFIRNFPALHAIPMRDFCPPTKLVQCMAMKVRARACPCKTGAGIKYYYIRAGATPARAWPCTARIPFPQQFQILRN